MRRTMNFASVTAMAAGAFGLITVGAVSAEDEFPSKTIEVVTHAGAGGGTDVTSRMMMMRTRRTAGQDMVVVNKKGGGGTAAMNYVMGRPADGYTVFALTIGHIAQLAQGKPKMTMDDIIPIARGTDDPQIFMASCTKAPFKTPKEFMAYSKDNTVSYGTTHVGSIDDVSAYIFTKRAGLKPPKIVPFKGGGELATNLVAGSVDVAVLNLSEASSQIDAGEICPMVVLAKERMKPLPDVPTALDLGHDVVFSTVRGFAVRKGVPAEHVAKLEKAMLEGMGHKYYQSFLETVGLEPNSVAGQEEWAAQVKTLHTEMRAALKEAGFSQ
ncbi:MAG: Bug family tripartite tricarboxylate transporter substrate binding protein [Gammaproteobacteria bacterium]